MRGFFSETLVPHIDGRLTRRRYWAATLMYLVVTGFLGWLWQMLFWQPMSFESWNFIDFLLSAAAIYFYIVLFSLVVRRLHDFNSSGWWAILFFVPGISFLFYIVIGCIGGTPATNNYGPAQTTGTPYDVNEAMESLSRLKASGVMTQEEYDAKVREIQNAQNLK